MDNSKAYAAASATTPLAGTTVVRRDPTEHDDIPSFQIYALFPLIFLKPICHEEFGYQTKTMLAWRLWPGIRRGPKGVGRRVFTPIRQTGRKRALSARRQ